MKSLIRASSSRNARAKRAFLIRFGPLHRGRILDAPVRGHRLARPDGTLSPAALSQTVKTKSSCGAPGAANSSQLLLRRPSVGS